MVGPDHPLGSGRCPGAMGEDNQRRNGALVALGLPLALGGRRRSHGLGFGSWKETLELKERKLVDVK